jgi:CheY-like chemotaxis protein
MQCTSEGSNTAVTVEMAAIGNKPYVLVVDDDPAISSVVKLILEMEGYAALTISDSLQVLPFLQHMEDNTRMPAVILLDLMMPGLSGYEIAAALTQHTCYAHIPIIIMTADHRVRAVNAIPGAVDLLTKPFQINVLLSKVEGYLAHVACG